MQRAINILKYFYDITDEEAKCLLEANDLDMRKVINILEDK